jgi:hypothetical protein
VRPTLGVFWLATFIVFATELHINRVRKILLFLTTSLIGLLALAITNIMRFGSPFEFGHSLNVFGNELVMYVMKWPSFHISYLWENFLDFIHALITYASNHHFMDNPLASESSYHRSKEFYFRLNTPIELFGGIICCFASIRSQHRESRIVTLYALVSGSLLFLFYLVSPIFSSRYLIDFAPCLYGAFLSVALLPITSSRDRQFGYCFGAFIILIATQFQADPLWYAATRSAVPSSKIFVHTPEAYKLFPLPTLEEHCPIQNLNSFFTSPVFLVERGWNLEKDCSVGFASSFIFRGQQCLTLRGNFSTPEQFAAKAGTKVMLKTYQSGRRVTFCLESPPDKEFEAYFVRYVNTPSKIIPLNMLKSIEAHQQD